MAGKIKHGLSRTKEYFAWAHARARCIDPEHEAYADYGARGITMAQVWLDSVVEFCRHMGPCPPGYDLDRRDNSKGYEPGNCRWVPRVVNIRNRRNSVRYDHDGLSLSLAEWAELKGLSYRLLKSRVALGWSIGQALTGPTTPGAKTRFPGVGFKQFTFAGITLTLREWAERVGIPYDTLRLRLKQLTFDQAITKQYSPRKQ